MSAADRQINPDIDSLFPDERKLIDGPVGFKDLPYLARPIVEHLHDARPHAVIAADRGARLIAFTAFASWKKRFPGERFPTSDRKIHFARVTGRSAEEEPVEAAVHHVLGMVGLATWHDQSQSAPKIAFLDDWVNEGATAKRFAAAVESFGLPTAGTSLITMCGKRIDTLSHVVSDPERDTINSIWNAYDEYAGVSYEPQNPTVPIAWPNEDATIARNRISQYIDTYYERFSTALAIGDIAACACVSAPPSTPTDVHQSHVSAVPA